MIRIITRIVRLHGCMKNISKSAYYLVVYIILWFLRALIMQQSEVLIFLYNETESFLFMNINIYD